MIVKNEEKVLRRCLESLKPLMSEIPSELIIADTGSTDLTFEIAKEYTDNVYHFEWQNDFAAARNSTLDRAKGKWYMFIDADEYLDEDIHEIVGFFRIPELYNHYKTATICLRNYKNNEKTDYHDDYLPRFQRISDNGDVRFYGAIHETIFVQFPLGYFQTILHHTGYTFQSKRQLVNKKERNLALMREEYRNTKGQGNMRILSLLLDGCTDYPEESEKYIDEALKYLEKDRLHIYGNALFIKSVLHYQYINPDYALKLCDKYYENAGDCNKYVATISILKFKAEILKYKGYYQEAFNTYQEYMKLYDDYKKEKMPSMDITGETVYGLTSIEYIRCVCDAAECLRRLRRYDEALSVLSEFDLNEIDGEEFTTVIHELFEICISGKDYSTMIEYYGLVGDSNGDKTNIILSLLQSVYFTLATHQKRYEFAEKIVNSNVSGMYVKLMELVIHESEEDIIHFIDEIETWNDAYSEIVFLTIKNNLDLIYLISKIPSSSFRGLMHFLAECHDDFAFYSLRYDISENYLIDIKRLYFIVSMFEGAVYRCFELNNENKYELYLKFINLLSDYVMNIYNPELLNDEEVCIIPELHQFGYFMGKAYFAFYSDDYTNYIYYMKKALISCESMKEIIEFLLNYFKRNILK